MKNYALISPIRKVLRVGCTVTRAIINTTLSFQRNIYLYIPKYIYIPFLEIISEILSPGTMLSRASTVLRMFVAPPQQQRTLMVLAGSGDVIQRTRSAPGPPPMMAEIQKRWGWTKARKKRQARWERRQRMAKAGIPVPKPPGYVPKDLPVVNAITREERIQEVKEHDEKVTAELQEKLALAQSKPYLRHHMTGLQMSDRVRKLFELHNGSQKEVVRVQKQRAMEVFQLREGDTGSSAVQVVALTTRIQQLQTHMARHKKDYSNKRGLNALLVRRRKVLEYMERKEFDAYRMIVKTLGLSLNRSS
jgi:small subunit ribosomal protein S15